MTQNMRMWAVGLALLALGGLAYQSYAGGAAKLGPDLRKIAKAIKAGDKAGAQKMAEKMAQKLEEVDEVMFLLKPRSKGGLGVGETPQAKSDGIEVRLRDIARDAPSNPKKDGPALEQMGYDTAAVALVAKAKAPAKDVGKKKVADFKKWADEMYESGVALAKSSAAGGAQEIKGAATKVNQSCTSCHSVFRE